MNNIAKEKELEQNIVTQGTLSSTTQCHKIEIKSLYFSYGKKKILKNVNLELTGGKIVGLIGPNGCGKSTLLKILTNFLQSYEGEILINGEKLGDETKKFISYLPDESIYPKHYNGEKLIKMFADLFPDFNQSKAIKLFQEFGISLSNSISTFSKGMVEKCNIALCLANQRPIYIMDEPLGGVDPATRDKILNCVINNYAENSLMIIATHLVHDIEQVLDEAIFMNDGEIMLHHNVESLRFSKQKDLETITKEIYL